MYRIASIVLIAFALVACGGDDDADDDSTSSSNRTPPTSVATTPTSSNAGKPTPAAPTTFATFGSEPTATQTGSGPVDATATTSTPAEATATTSTNDPDSAEGAPTHASSDFPDVRVPLEVGSSAEVGSMDPDPFGDTSSRHEESRVKVTINEILDPAELEGTIFGPEPGNRWFAIDITMEATGSEIANTGIWTLATSDGIEYTNIITLGSTPDITYGSIEPGATAEGLVVFEIPEDSVVQWILMSPTIFVGDNLVFVN